MKSRDLNTKLVTPEIDFVTKHFSSNQVRRDSTSRVLSAIFTGFTERLNC